MSKEGNDGFIPVRLNFNANAGEEKYYIYSIRNRQKDKYYIGISRNPVRRINEQLRIKAELSLDYALAAAGDQAKPPQERTFEYGILNPEGYPSAFLGCIAETLYMVALERQNIHIYNQNKFGGHPELKDKRAAFEAIVMIIDPSLKGNPSEKNMIALERHIGEIRNFVSASGNTDIINDKFLTKLDRAWDDYITAKRENGFGRAAISLEKVRLPKYMKLAHVNDNDAESDQNTMSL